MVHVLAWEHVDLHRYTEYMLSRVLLFDNVLCPSPKAAPPSELEVLLFFRTMVFFSEAVHRFFQAKICLLNLLISHHHHHQCTPRRFTGFLSGVAAPELWESEGLLPSFDGDVLIHINSKLISEGAKMSSLVRAFKCLDISLSYLVVAF